MNLHPLTLDTFLFYFVLFALAVGFLGYLWMLFTLVFCSPRGIKDDIGWVDRLYDLVARNR